MCQFCITIQMLRKSNYFICFNIQFGRSQFFMPVKRVENQYSVNLDDYTAIFE